MEHIEDLLLILFCAPIVILIGYLGHDAPSIAFILLLMLGIYMLIHGVMRTIEIKQKANAAIEAKEKAYGTMNDTNGMTSSTSGMTNNGSGMYAPI